MAQLLKLTTMLTLVALCLFEFTFRHYSKSFSNCEQGFLSLPCLSSVSLLIWCGVFTGLTREKRDVFVIVFLAIAAFYFFLNINRPSTETFILFFSLAISKGMRFFSKQSGAIKSSKACLAKANIVLPDSSVNFLIGLVLMLVCSSWLHLDFTKIFYHGPRWMGLWDNPNTYGMLMGAGSALAIGLLAANAKLKIKNSKANWFLGLAVFMLGVGLAMSYSRGAWLGAAIGLLYLAWNYGKLKWRYVLPVTAGAAVLILFLWGSTQDSAPWYVKRADLGRPSAQHRVSAWHGAVQMMRDHPFGVGWNNAVSVYAKDYSPPEDGAAAITTNDYLMLGTELGIPALLCFVAYVGLCYWKSPRIQQLESRSQDEANAPSSLPSPPMGAKESEALRAACLSGALVFVVAFWFDGGLFKLPTAAMFWVLLELGAAHTQRQRAGMKNEAAAVKI